MSDLSLTARNMTVIQGKKPCLIDVSLSLKGGDLLGIIGPNGAGKTTLVKSLLGLLPLSKGSVFLNDQPLERLSPSQRGRKIAYLPQERFLPYGLTVEEVIHLGRLPYRKEKAPQQQAVTEKILHDLKLHELRFRRVETVSGGEKARICLARALAVESPFLLIDEPSAALDPAQAMNMMELLSQKTREEQIGICIVLHDLSLAAQYCSRIAFLKQGRLITEGASKDVITEDILQAVYETDIKVINGIPVPVRRSWPYSSVTGRDA